MNRKNASATGREWGTQHLRTQPRSREEYIKDGLFFAQQNTGCGAIRSTVARDLFMRGWKSAWKEPEPPKPPTNEQLLRGLLTGWGG